MQARYQPALYPDDLGLGGRARTCDLMLPKHLRCQLRYAEMKNWCLHVDSNNGPAPYQDAALGH
jgi:hypothetical protein